MDYLVKDKYGEVISVSDEDRQKLIAMGKRTEKDFSPVDDDGTGGDADFELSSTAGPDYAYGGNEDIYIKPTPKESLEDAVRRSNLEQDERLVKPLGGDSSVQQIPPNASVLFPAMSTARENGLPLGVQALGAGKDLLTVIPRFAAGTGAALGDFAGGLLGGLPVREAFRSANTTGAEAMRSPEKSVAETDAYTPGWQRHLLNPHFYADMAESPMTIGAAALPEMALPLASYASNSAERQLAGRGTADAWTSETPGQLAVDALPLGGKALGLLAGGKVASVGGWMQGKAPGLLKRAVKPSAKKMDAWMASVPTAFQEDLVQPTFARTIDATNNKLDQLAQRREDLANNLYGDVHVDLPAAVDASESALNDAVHSGRIMPNTVGKPLDDLYGLVENVTENGPATVPQALRTRQTFDNYSKAYEPGVLDAYEVLGKKYRKEVNSQLDRVAPKVREVDRQMSPVIGFSKAIPEMQTRQKNYPIGLRDLAKGAVTGAAGTLLGPFGFTLGSTGGVAASMAERSPLAAYATYHNGQRLMDIGANLKNSLPLRARAWYPMLNGTQRYYQDPSYDTSNVSEGYAQ